jgi:hypothetical protein
MDMRVAPKMFGRRGTSTHDDVGAVLILAMVFLIGAGMAILSLVGLSGNDLLNTSHLNTVRSLDYAAGGATEVAMWNTRYSFTSATASPVACSGTNPSVLINGQYFEVWCSTVPNPGTSNTRVVTFLACPLTAAAASSGLTSVCPQPSLQAVVTFNDYNDLNVDQCLSASVQGSCGTGMTLNSWIVK